MKIPFASVESNTIFPYSTSNPKLVRATKCESEFSMFSLNICVLLSWRETKRWEKRERKRGKFSCKVPLRHEVWFYSFCVCMPVCGYNTDRSHDIFLDKEQGRLRYGWLLEPWFSRQIIVYV